MVPSTRVATSGMVVADRYRLLEPLGAGGMGAVWRAEHVSLRSPVAIKLLNPAIADDPEMLERFLREAQSAAALRGTYVVQVFDYGVHEGMPFIAMELLSGITLGMRLAAVRQLGYADLSWVFAHVSRAVSKAHELGIVHRDLKPDNIFIVRDGDEELAKVLDFGIAKVLPSSTPLEEDASKTTRTGTVLGTPFYMSPEQARGNRTVDLRADLWSMGVIAFECLTGRLPFASSALGDLVVKICTQPAPRPSDLAEVPPGFDEWFARSCEKTPEARFQSMREQNEALQTLLGTSGAPLSPNRSTPRARRVTQDQAPLSRDLSIDFGDFHTLESAAPPGPAGQGPDNQRQAPTLDPVPAAGKRTSSAVPVAVSAATSRVRPRWLNVVLLGTLVLGFAALINRTKGQSAAHAPPAASTTGPSGVIHNAALGVGVVLPVVRTQAASSAAHSPSPPAAPVNEAPSARSAAPRSPTASNTAPMDSPAAPVKLPKKGSGVTRGAEPASPAPAARTAVEPPSQAMSTTVLDAPGPEAVRTTPTPTSVAGPKSSATFRGRELFDDRE